MQLALGSLVPQSITITPLLHLNTTSNKPWCIISEDFFLISTQNLTSLNNLILIEWDCILDWRLLLWLDIFWKLLKTAPATEKILSGQDFWNKPQWKLLAASKQVWHCHTMVGLSTYFQAAIARKRQLAVVHAEEAAIAWSQKSSTLSTYYSKFPFSTRKTVILTSNLPIFSQLRHH